MNSAGNLGGFLCSIVFGYLVKASGQYNLSVAVVGIMVMLSAFLFLRIDPDRQVEKELKGDSHGDRQMLAREG